MDFPQLKAYFRLDKDQETESIYDIKFCPYLPPGADPVFAAVAGRETYICTPVCKSSTSKIDTVKVLMILEDPDKDTCLNSIAWSVDFKADEPLVCVAGSGSNDIKIWNAVTGDLVRILHGHGGDINDLATSPASPYVLASCSSDYSIRIWNLDPKYERQPCAAILSGEGHRQSILTIDFHDNGKWLLSGGQDTMVCLWTIPNVPDENAGSDTPTAVVYPHFASINMHSDYVDWYYAQEFGHTGRSYANSRSSVKFWGDLVLAKASTGNNIHVKRGEIILWKIDGFASDDENPPEPPMPGYGRATRSAFGGGFQRLYTFDLIGVEPFYMRFGLFKEPGQRPMLAMGNIKARYYFWDLQRFEEGNVKSVSTTAAVKNNKRKRTLAEQALMNSTRASSIASNLTGTSRATDRSDVAIPALTLAAGSVPNTVSATTMNQNPSAAPELAPNGPPASAPTSTRTSQAPDSAAKRSSHAIKNYTRYAAHKTMVVPCPLDFACRAIDWSPDGKWCVAVGDHGMMAIFGRGMGPRAAKT